MAHAADEGTLPNGATITWDMLFITENGTAQQPSTPEALRRYLNLAHCVCSQENEGDETSLSYQIKLTADTGGSYTGELWVGEQCFDNVQRPMQCRRIESQSIADIDQLVVQPARIDIPIYDVFNGAQEGACRQREGAATAWLLVGQGGSTYDYASTQSVGVTSMVTGIDTRPPPLPTNIKAAGGEGSIDLTWDPPTSNETDVYAYQAFCARADDDSAGRTDPPTRLYDTTSTVCGIAQEFALERVDLSASDGGEPVDAPLAAFANLDEAFLCGEEISGTARGMSLTGLEDGVAYKVAVVSVDLYGNAAGLYLTQTLTPKPVTDFWEDLQDRNSKVEGGCLSTSRDAGGLVIALAIAFPLVLRRRRRGGVVAATLLAGGLASTSVARADDFTPYWEDPEIADQASLDAAESVRWHFGIRVGPYIPDIDLQAGRNALTMKGPYEAMFGDWYLEGTKHERRVWQAMPVLDVDRVLWEGFGQLTAGGSLGYMQKTAHAYLQGTSEDDPMRERSRTSKTRFRMLPLAATVGYRFTYLDDRFGIPVVPYVRGGLSYYIWDIEGPGGTTSSVCEDGTTGETCAKNEARGASAGFQGSVGLAIRAERIDTDAARSMRAGGIQHAGFYAEWFWAKVDGFGSETKLAVGASTWFAGVDFEF